LIHDTSSAYYRKRKLPIFTAELYQDVGVSFCVSILDLFCLNPLTRLLKSESDTPDQALEKLRADIKKSIAKPSISKMKAKAKKGKKKKKSEGPTFEMCLVPED
jgi:hypothetical protein